MAGAPYLTRREGGRYYLQIRLGKRAQALYGREFLRASLRTSDYAEARRRLVDNLGWAREVADAPDLDVLGTVLHARLTAYTNQGSPGTERVLAERVAFENQVRSFLTRSNERGYPFAGRFDGFASRWVDFVSQNKAAEEDLIRVGLRREYERGLSDVLELFYAYKKKNKKDDRARGEYGRLCRLWWRFSTTHRSTRSRPTTLLVSTRLCPKSRPESRV